MEYYKAVKAMNLLLLAEWMNLKRNENQRQHPT